MLGILFFWGKRPIWRTVSFREGNPIIDRAFNWSYQPLILKLLGHLFFEQLDIKHSPSWEGRCSSVLEMPFFLEKVSNENTRTTGHYTGYLIGIPIVGYNKPYNKGEYNPIYNLNNQAFFIAQLELLKDCSWGLLKKCKSLGRIVIFIHFSILSWQFQKTNFKLRISSYLIYGQPNVKGIG